MGTIFVISFIDLTINVTLTRLIIERELKSSCFSVGYVLKLPLSLWHVFCHTI
jgi:hypothetical protein